MRGGGTTPRFRRPSRLSRTRYWMQEYEILVAIAEALR